MLPTFDKHKHKSHTQHDVTPTLQDCVQGHAKSNAIENNSLDRTQYDSFQH